ncbi:LLM class flavin-dependent oxidoreductase [Amycolatopsis ultiminotia]|uniref:LLM class flavin-dependent oxidoreductase n=1 Tax=Amycolatopsis ultiminotia TaxID=543629 RepID=A0ABP6XBL5_9PSEU
MGLVLDAAKTADPRRIGSQVQAAERHGLGFLLFDDGPGEPAGRGYPDPVEVASFASATTRAIGLVVTAAATHAEPFHLSNRFSSLDWGSSGRAGWLVTVDASTARAAAYSASPPDAATAPREAGAVVDAARRLWDSWEDGALIADSATGRFLDQEKLHYVDVHNEFFRIRGPALLPRPKQGQLPVFARARDHLAQADVVLVDGWPGGAVGEHDAHRTFAEVAVTPATDFGPLLRGLSGRADGVLLRAGDTDAVLEELGRRVLPELIADRTVLPPRPGETLREQLGLPRPVSRYATIAGKGAQA